MIVGATGLPSASGAPMRKLQRVLRTRRMQVALRGIQDAGWAADHGDLQWLQALSRAMHGGAFPPPRPVARRRIA